MSKQRTSWVKIRSNFQEFFNSEKLEILAMFEELPEGFHKQEGLKYLVRRINGQDDPAMPECSCNCMGWIEHARGGRCLKLYLMVVDINGARRMILHEKAHFLWAYTFDQDLKR